MNKKKLLCLIFSVSALIGCGQNAQVEQSKMCVYSNDVEAKRCKAGEMSWYNPSKWGNEQTPLGVAAAYCDFNYSIMFNNAGVICVFTDKRLSLVK
ncbi:hypothetical protein [Shewanella glacialipiscicola]|jgi:hypothetical protein|uniref:hypothetical protein n=1 Tax=Shewanella glacialipiscicola TaxID=614069 RepID=UPI003D7B888C